ncbi:MAG TPA: glycerol-3-phosphate 1-O-acyltransferase PlsY, partial [Microvirga sp.]|nr:glycerol-3-phosphate 1-O-acyltransferase PlsY [Microvirga sp.]
MSDEMNMLYLLGALAFGYLLGSIPFGVIFTRMAGLGDIRKVGSGNIGATNVLRTGRKGLAAATLLGDALKGTAAVLIAARWGDQFATLAALGAFLGHLYPVWLKFKGGKGVATFIGILIGLNWIAALIFVAIWLGVAFASRYSSLSALIASAATPVALWLLGAPAMAAMTVILVALLWWKHSPNISR